MKVTNVFKVIIIACLVITFTVSMISCKEAPVVEEQVEEQQIEEKGEVTIPSETQKETPPAVEETPEVIEWEGMSITPIEGLRFEEGTFFAEAGNPYNLEVGEKAGVFVKDAVEINGVMESSIGLRPEVIEVMQKEIMEKDKEFRYPLPFDFEQAKGIKIREVAYKSTDEWTKKDGVFWDKNSGMDISNVPLGTIIYSPINTSSEGYRLVENHPQERDDYYILTFLTNPREKLFRGNERVDAGVAVSIGAIGIKPLPEGIKEMIPDPEVPFAAYRSDVKMGIPVAEIISKEYLDDKYWGEKENPEQKKHILSMAGRSRIDPSSEPSINIDCEITQLKDPDKPFTSVDQLSKYLLIGLEGLLKLGEEEIFVFISPVHE